MVWVDELGRNTYVLYIRMYTYIHTYIRNTYVYTYHTYHTYIHTDIKCISSDTNNARTSNSSSIGRHTSTTSCRKACSVDPCKDVPCKGGALGEKVSEKTN